MRKHLFVSIYCIVCSLVLVHGQESARKTSQLIVCFPISRDISITGEVDTITHASGNTLSMASIIHELTGADVFEIELVSPYSSNYNTVLMEAKEDQKNRARPEMTRLVKNMDQYDMIFLGFPNWWASIPMPIATFLEIYYGGGSSLKWDVRNWLSEIGVAWK